MASCLDGVCQVTWEVSGLLRKLLLQPLDDVGASLNLIAQTPRPMRTLVLATVFLVIFWFLYVPIHELMHAAGCVLAGGTVTELQIAPQYGGTLLARWFPFVVSGGDYAGRLSGFDWHDSDLIYLATDFAPYLLTVLIGVPLMRSCARRAGAIRFGLAVVVGLAPFYSLPGDYFEMGSIITTRAASILLHGGEVASLAGLRSDDVFKLIADVFGHPEKLELAEGTSTITALAIVSVSFLVGVVLALGTYALGGFIPWMMRWIMRRT